ncbi:MAG: hypothetical protein M0Q42_04995 [Xanthomonadales bacterium]|nr:hypothetical protein [Xanthomonadales bacterium]
MSGKPVRVIGAQQQTKTTAPGLNRHQAADPGTLQVQRAVFEQPVIQETENLLEQRVVGIGGADQIHQLAAVLGIGQTQP